MTNDTFKVPTEGEIPNTDQTEEEKKAVKLVERLFKEAKEAKEKYSNKWPTFKRFFHGYQWETKRPEYRHSEVYNLIFTSVQTVIPILTDSRPNIECVPANPGDFEFSEMLTQIFRSNWDKNLWDQNVAYAIVDMLICGCAFSHVPWNDDLEDGLGDYDFEIPSPTDIFPDPDTKEINDEDGEYLIFIKDVKLSRAKRMFPKVKDYIKADDSYKELEEPNYNEDSTIKIKSPVDAKTMVESNKNGASSNKTSRTLIKYCYMKSYEETEEEVKTKDDEGNETTGFQTKKKYPNGRLIITCGGALCYDDENPYIDGKFPFARLSNFLTPREFWSKGEVEPLMSPNIIVNKLISYILDYMTLMGNPIWIVDSNSNIDTDNLFNAPGSIIEKTPGSEVRRESGVQLPPYIFQMLNVFANGLYDKISGLHEVSQGATPPVMSGIAIDRLQEAAQTKLRLKSRNIERWLKATGKLMLSRIMQFYAIPRIVRITDNQNAARYFSFAIKDSVNASGEGQKIAEYFELSQDPTSGQMVTGQAQSHEIKGNIDVVITTGTSLPLKKQMKANLAMQLFDKQVIDAQQLLEDLEYPNKEKILERMNQAASIQAAQPQQGM